MAIGRGRGVILAAGAVLLAIGFTAVAVLLAAPSADEIGRLIAASVKHATGRDLAIRGPARMGWSWSPVLTLNDVALANAEDSSRPVMMSAPRIEARVRLLPLLFGRVAIDQLTVVEPDVWLERTQKGEPNWRLSPFAPGAALVPAPIPAPPSEAAPASVSIARVRVEGGTVTSHGPEGDTVLTVASLDLTSSGEDDPIGVAGQLGPRGLPIDVTGETGSWSGLQDLDRKTPWPVRLTLAAGDARATVAGGLAKPLQMRGYVLRLDGVAPDLSLLQPLIPSVTLPALRDLTVSAQLSEGPTGNPRLASLIARAGPSDLSAYADGLSLAKLDVAMPGTDKPVRASVEGIFAGQPLRISGTIGAPGALLGGNQVAGAMPVDLSAVIAGATVTARGIVGNPARLTGADLAVSARIPDLAALSPLAGQALPPFQAIVGTARLRDRDGGLARGVVLQGIKLSAAQGDLGGDVTVGFGPLPSVQGSVTSSRVDLDAIQAAVAPPSGPPPDRAPANPDQLLSDAPLPFGRIPGADADLRFKVTSLIAGGTTYRDANGRLAVKDGKLRLDPLSAQTQGGAFAARLTVDTTVQPDPAVGLALRAANVPLKSLLAAADLPDDATGTAELDLDLRGTGSTARAIVAGGNGRLAVAAVNGRVGGRVLSALVAEPLRRAGQPGSRFLGQSELRCLAGRLDLRNGVGTLRGFYLNTADAELAAAGTVDFTNDTLALVLMPTTRNGVDGTPIRVTGPIEDPKAAVQATDQPDPARLPRRLLDPGAEACTQPLAFARDGRPGPMPVSLAPVLPPPLVPLTPIPLAPMTQYPPQPAPLPPGRAPIPLTPPAPGVARPAAPAPSAPQAGTAQQRPVDLFQFLR